jgi:two-component system sensor histidine kinase QseC
MAPPTLQRQLLAWALGALTAVWSVFIAIGYLTGVHEADELTDGHLASVAALLLAQPDPRFAEPVDAARLGIPARLSAHDYQHSLSVAVWDGSGRLLARSGPAPDPPPDLPEGFATVPLGAPATDWRVFSRWSNAAHDRRIAVLLSIRERRALESDIALHVAAPGFWLLPLVALVLTLAIRRGLRPLTALSERVGRMDVRQDHRLQAPPHAEFQAMVRAIEALSGRYREALARERELADSFAHELRTPLAALTLHVESLRGALPAAMHDAIVGPIEQDAARTSAIVDDLLALARASRVELAEAAQPLDLAAGRLRPRPPADPGARRAAGHRPAQPAAQRAGAHAGGHAGRGPAGARPHRPARVRQRPRRRGRGEECVAGGGPGPGAQGRAAHRRGAWRRLPGSAGGPGRLALLRHRAGPGVQAGRDGRAGLVKR